MNLPSSWMRSEEPPTRILKSPGSVLQSFFVTCAFCQCDRAYLLAERNRRGFYWTGIGAMNGGLAPIPVHATVAEMNPDCTGKLQYAVNLPNLSATIEERFFLFDEGRKFRSVPTSIQGGIDTLA